MIDTAFIGHEMAPHHVDIERGRLRFFARVIGEEDPVYRDPEAARAAGYRDLLVPPTFLFCLEMEVDAPFAIYEAMGAPLERLLHGEQQFHYYATACAGDTLRFAPRIADIYSKKQGALTFIVKETAVHDQHEAHVADLRSVAVVRGES